MSAAILRGLQLRSTKMAPSRIGSTTPWPRLQQLTSKSQPKLSHLMAHDLPTQSEYFLISGGPLPMHRSHSSATHQDKARNLNMVTPHTARGLLLDETGIAHASDAKPIIGGYGAIRSVIVAMYCHNTNTAALAHMDEHSAIKETITELKNSLLKHHPSAKLQVSIASERLGHNNQTYLKIKQLINQYGDLQLTQEVLSGGMAIDARTGGIYFGVQINQLDLGEDSEQRRRVMITRLLDMLDKHIQEKTN